MVDPACSRWQTSNVIRVFAVAAACLAFLVGPVIAEPASDWMDGIFAGNVEDFFVDQTPAVKAFVQAHLDLATEAASHLLQCPTEDNCNFGQTRFILDYVAAFYNDNNSQDNVAALLAGDEMPPKLLNEGNEEAYMAPDPIIGCAWRITTLLSDAPDVSDVNFMSYLNDCQDLSSDGQSQAHNDAILLILPKIHAAMAKGTIPFDLVDDYPGSP